MDDISKRRLVTWCCHWLRKRQTREGVLLAAAERNPPFPAEWIEEVWPHVEQACRNTAALNAAPESARLGDICRILP